MVLKTSSRSLRPSRDLLIRQLLEVEIVQGGHLRLQAARPDVLAPRMEHAQGAADGKHGG